MPAVIRRFERRDRDQLTELVNLHIAAVIPGVVVPVNTVLSQLEREPGESIVDPWVAERLCLVAEVDQRIVAATLLHRFRVDADVSAAYRGTGDVRWIVCEVDATGAGHALLTAAIAQMRHWRVSMVGAECALAAPGCYGIPDTMPHLRTLLSGAGFAGPTRRELVLAARCADLIVPDLGTGMVVRTVGTLGPRFTVQIDDRRSGYIEVCQPGPDLARSSPAVQWADIGNLILADGAHPASAIPLLLSVAARWLLLGGITRLIAYWACDVDAADHLVELQRAGFQTLVRNDRGFQRAT